MGYNKSVILSAVLSLVHIVHGEIWKFGEINAPGSSLLSHEHGTMGFFERNKQIAISVPPCNVVTYVEVKVDNLISTPNVFFNPQTNLVTISYKLWQNGHCSYDIISKAVWIQGCDTVATTDPF